MSLFATGEVQAAGDNGIKQNERPLEEVIVSAQRRNEDIQKVPISISVLNGADLDSSPSQGVAEVLNSVPGVAITPGSRNDTQITVRGVAAAGSLFFGSSPIAYYLDSVPFGLVKTAVTPDANAYDLDRIEVLRGPQGTLYGASAQNGVVRVLTRDADLNQMEFKARASASSTQYGGENYRGDLALNMPIVEGALAARAVIGYQDLSGWIDQPNVKDANRGELQNARLKINAQPTERLSIGASAWLSRSDFDAPATGDDNRRTRISIEEYNDADYDSFGLKVGYSAAAFTVTSSTSYLDYAFRNAQESNAFNGSNVLTTNLDADVFAQEISLTSNIDGPWRWSLGAMYRDAEDRTFQVRRNSLGQLTGGYRAPIDFTNLSESYALFGEITRLLFDGRIELTGGVRYFEDEVGQREDSSNTVAGGVPPAGLISTSRKFDAVSPRAVLTWHPAERMTLYASYSEGFRSGADQTPPAIALSPNLTPTEPDTLKNYELGWKSSLIGGLLAIDAAVYYMDWEDVQTPFLAFNSAGTPFSVLVNGEAASGMGFDLGLSAIPIDGLTVSATYSVNDLTQDADVRSGTILIFRKGERLNFSPKRTVGGSLDYEFALGGSGYTARFSTSANYTSSRTSRSFFITSTTVNNKSLLISRAAFSVESPDHWVMSLFADNLNNEQDAVVAAAAGQPLDRAARLRPRTVGLQLEYQF